MRNLLHYNDDRFARKECNNDKESEKNSCSSLYDCIDALCRTVGFGGVFKEG